MKFQKIIGGLAAVSLSATTLVACGADGGGEPGEGGPIRIGSTDTNMREWDVFADLAEEEGIDIEIVDFSDYNTPNDALAQDQIDVNKFQHLQFLSEYNVGSNADLTPISATEIYPLALFWQGHDSLDGIEGEEIAIPNDSTNQGRAINVLVQAGLVTLREDGLINPTPADIDEEASDVTVTPVDAAQTAAVYQEGNPAVINNSFLERAGIDPKEAIFQDDPSNEEAEPYINVWVTTPDNADNEEIHRLAELWKDPAVEEAVLESSGGTAVPVDRSQEELQEILDRLESEAQ
ncbi:methionine ABC transporter substrate-binding protein [Corynebacterium yudongzhengii]|uniref:Methionine ABC transporter substrate-binding protein n=1 Tax=Corynebacterium yudongzhengii TaxID=2080740 RepID=A0A2U1T798_9CORY|nr:MetQ/NlpA family ABC transporter substrate-binding protein [Corynebacterium yudongzhengii]AWB81325.1 methionine ABC transporter substrate-binding protein [Corynebacterium yudongzhengii]PWC01768.1 methionine ABC transporter substrate-binding protein [Corynebacterium yudongzhengii]